MSLFPLVSFDSIDLGQANDLLLKWGHRMSELHRGNQSAWCHALFHEGKPVAVTCASTLITPSILGDSGFTRENTIELSRLCASRPGLCRVILRLWREFFFPVCGFQWAMSYQDLDVHTGNTYRFDGWKRIGRSRSGPDTRSGRPGRDKWIWIWPNDSVKTPPSR